MEEDVRTHPATTSWTFWFSVQSVFLVIASTSMERNWADLPQELLQQCSQLFCPKNLSVFQAVCRSWQSAAVKERSDVPCLMLADKNGMLWREFFCLRCQRVHKKLLPEAMANQYFSSRGWVLTISRDWEFHMLKNPMSRYNHIIKLPSWNKFPNIFCLHFMFTSSGSSSYLIALLHLKITRSWSSTTMDG